MLAPAIALTTPREDAQKEEEPAAGMAEAAARKGVSRKKGVEASDELQLGRKGTESLKLPIATKLRDERRVEVDVFRSEGEVSAALEIFNASIDQGNVWPMEEPVSRLEFEALVMSDAAFVLRATEDGYDEHGAISKAGAVLGVSFCKPRYPGRGGHVCTGGCVGHHDFRRKGIGRLLAATFLQFARDLDYQLVYIEPVFESNLAALMLWESLGFQRVAELPSALQTDADDFDAALGLYFDIENELPSDFDPLHCGRQRDSLVISFG